MYGADLLSQEKNVVERNNCRKYTELLNEIFVLGATGMVGHTVSMYLEEQDHDVVGLDLIKTAHISTPIVGDARDTAKIDQVIKRRSVLCRHQLHRHFEPTRRGEKSLGVF